MRMKITLVVTNSEGKNQVFVSDSLQTTSLEEAIRVADKGLLENVYSVRGKFGAYLRSLPNTSEKDNLDTRSVTAADIIAYANHARHFKSTDAISMYAAQYIASISEQGGPFVETVDGDRALIAIVRDTITPHIKIIKQAAKEFDIDPYLLGAIIVDEVVRLSPFEYIRDVFLLNLLGRNVSVGIAQVKLETANNVIKKGLYNPNSEDKKLPFFGNLKKKDREYLYQYVIEPRQNIRFAAAYVRDVIDVWAKKLDISKRPEIVATLYAQGYGDPKLNPKSNERGEQIAAEFYRLAKRWIG